MNNTTVGILLAGGKSQRFGEPKAFYKLNGKYFYESSIDASQEYVSNSIVVSHPALYKTFQSQLHLDVILDDYKYQGLGPLAGIYSALNYVQADQYLVLPCDIPYMGKSVIKVLIEQAELHKNKDAIVPIVDGRKQPLIAVYRHRCLPIIKNLLDQNQLKMGILLQSVDTLYVEENMFTDLTLFQNINRKEDLL